MPNVVASLYHDLTSPTTNPPAWAQSGRIWITLLMVILAPLASLRRLDSLRHTSYVVLFAVGEPKSALLFHFKQVINSKYTQPSISRGHCRYMLFQSSRRHPSAR